LSELTQQVIDQLLRQQDAEFLSGFTSASTVLPSVIASAREPDLLAAGIRELRSRDPRRRILGIRLIRELRQLQEEAAVVLADLLGHEDDAEVIYWVAGAFGFLKSDSVTDRLSALAEHLDPGVRYQVATALANCSGDELPATSRDVLLALCRDENAEVRFSAIFELGSWWLASHDARIESALTRALADADRLVARAAGDALTGR
jgi:hypothetical protein